MVRILTREELKKILSMEIVIDVVEKGFLELYKGTAKMPLRSLIDVQEHKGTILCMPCYLEENHALAIKIVSTYESNPEKGLPTVIATVQLNDPATGNPLAIMEGTHLTAMRTGATSGVATKYLARDDATIAGIIGAGVQGKTQLMAVKEVRPIEKALVFDIITEKATSFAEEMSEKLGIEVQSVESAEKVVKSAEILNLATTAREPVINGKWIKEGTHINSVGWTGKEGRELDTQTVKMAKMIVDSKEAVFEESGDILIPIKENAIGRDHIYAELGELIGEVKKGRVSEKEVTLFKSVGVAIEDAITAKLAYEQAVEKNLGREIDFES
ncbi:MAG: ornithine cyclodeaminase family protein [Candidatus Korarchaeota archaeon]|nr:ornithine cyclodeaminase family protein [Candidatus Korarchaeota archaeon]NIU82048.1 ornithine cyclodeaminase family protein [Candidatus Thorarchaeota archaeon]NIW12467.1 ornithine cyclodeaminase family protein [Candidatus Thorarchaeota archaeon]NIW50682.1 ornithine cyclodeaminase family protein [Candidatus Korarchaeota archaeon]